VRPRDLVYDSLKQRILLNALAPETALTELGLAQEMGASQGTVREALLRLQEDGLVTRSGHRGTTVTPLDAEAAIEMLALRRQIEQRGALRAAARIDAAGLGALTELQRRMDGAAAAGEAYRLIELDVAFHMTIFRAAGLGALEPILNRCMLHTHRHKLWAPRHNRPLAETAARHRPILTALKQGGEALAASLGQHIDTIVDLAPERIAS
jgi:DNA-binding GntR family transcriptional regulator